MSKNIKNTTYNCIRCLAELRLQRVKMSSLFRAGWHTKAETTSRISQNNSLLHSKIKIVQQYVICLLCILLTRLNVWNTSVRHRAVKRMFTATGKTSYWLNWTFIVTQKHIFSMSLPCTEKLWGMWTTRYSLPWAAGQAMACSYGTRSFTKVFTKAHNLALSLTNWYSLHINILRI
jgi:hypothetical protein